MGCQGVGHDWANELNWTGQCCDSLCHTSTWLGHRCTCVPSILNPLRRPSSSHLARWSQSASFWQVPCVIHQTPPGLSVFTCFTHGNVYVGLYWWLLQCRRREFGSWVGEDPLEEAVATHPSILVWRIPWTEEPGGLQSMGHKKSDTTEMT